VPAALFFGPTLIRDFQGAASPPFSFTNPRGPQKKPSTLTSPPCLSLLVTVPQGTRKMTKTIRR